MTTLGHNASDTTFWQEGRPVPYALRLEPWAGQEWKVKIFELEGPEDPHVTIYRRASPRWRLNLRSAVLMDRNPLARDLPPGLVEAVLERLADLRAAWDRLHPENPIMPREDENE